QPGVWDNFATSASQISAILDFQLPLEGSLGGLVLADTSELSTGELPDLATVSEGQFRLVLENRFPVEVSLEAVIYDQNWEEVYRLSEDASLDAGVPNDQGYVETPTQSVIETEALGVADLETIFETGAYLVFRFEVDSQPEDEDVRIYADYDIMARLMSQFQFMVE
ncbi:MAG: hypothetical protein AAF399_16545, partial [Bacteroidota bacterium]